eukprot:GHVL01020443.1.p1 GENE.GHVL01020443.1~~GHVL01020443.1.p1  ORF type:complete len:539 (+),score=115.98 GHVL01020443.1:167-1783(+)
MLKVSFCLLSFLKIVIGEHIDISADGSIGGGKSINTDILGLSPGKVDCQSDDLSASDMNICTDQLLQMFGIDRKLTYKECEGDICNDIFSTSPRRPVGKYYKRIDNSLTSSTNITEYGSLYCISSDDCACNDKCVNNLCEGGCDHSLTDGEVRIDGGGNCLTSECYTLAFDGFKDFDSDSRSEYVRNRDQNDMNSGSCIFHNICGVSDVSAVSLNGAVDVDNLVYGTNYQEAKLVRRNSRKISSFDVEGSCTDRVGDPLVSSCYYNGSHDCPQGYTKTINGSYTFCRGDFTCVRQTDSFFINGDRSNGSHNNPAEVTACQTSADCCGSWKRWRDVYNNKSDFRSNNTNIPYRSNVPVTCIPYSEISAGNGITDIIQSTTGRSSSDKVCWLHGGGSEIYLTNSIKTIPNAVTEQERLLTNGQLYPAKKYLAMDICDETVISDDISILNKCENPCTGIYDLSFDNSTCNCYDGIVGDRPNKNAINSQNLKLKDCLQRCWQGHISNTFITSTICNGKCVIQCNINAPDPYTLFDYQYISVS